MKHIGIIPNLLKDKDLETTKVVISWLLGHDFNVYMTHHIGSLLDESIQTLEEEHLYETCEVLITIGGDGTILSVAQKACLYDKPIIGINLGRLGFLADVEMSEIDQFLPKLLIDDYTIEERMMLMIKVIDPSGEAHKFYALNDAYVARGSSSRISEFEIKVNEHFLDLYPADGIIIATPTGSTAYNLSAGGPIVAPSTSQIMITPICPHSIYSRAVIVADTDAVQIKTNNYDGTTLELVVDGQMKMNITPMHFIEVRKAPYTTKLIKLSDLHFFEILRKKIVERRK